MMVTIDGHLDNAIGSSATRRNHSGMNAIPWTVAITRNGKPLHPTTVPHVPCIHTSLITNNHAVTPFPFCFLSLLSSLLPLPLSSPSLPLAIPQKHLVMCVVLRTACAPWLLEVFTATASTTSTASTTATTTTGTPVPPRTSPMAAGRMDGMDVGEGEGAGIGPLDTQHALPQFSYHNFK